MTAPRTSPPAIGWPQRGRAPGTTAGGTTVANTATLRINNVAIGTEAVTINGTGFGAAGALQGTGAGASLAGDVLTWRAQHGRHDGGGRLADALRGGGRRQRARGSRGRDARRCRGRTPTPGRRTSTRARWSPRTRRCARSTGGATVVANTATLRINNVAIGAKGSHAQRHRRRRGWGTAGHRRRLARGRGDAEHREHGRGDRSGGRADALGRGGRRGRAHEGRGRDAEALSGANTYTGATNVNAGTVVASNATALGTTGGATTVAAGATLNINNVAIGAETVTLNGTLQGTGAAASLAGNVALARRTGHDRRGGRHADAVGRR